LHKEPTLAALKAGVPTILQEKPLATTLADAQEIHDEVEARKARLFVNYANRAAPLDIATRYVMQQGLLGPVAYGESRLDDNICVPTQMWGGRSREWAAGSSTVHFLLSHVVDLLRFYFRPAKVTDVYAISQQQVLGYTPDVYDAFLTFDSGMRVRVKAEWIKHIDELVEFYMCFSGHKGTLIYNKRGGFGTEPGWRANLPKEIDVAALLGHQEALSALGANMRAMFHRPEPMAGALRAGAMGRVPALEYRGLGYGRPMALSDAIIAAILGDTLEPDGWEGLGPLPTHEDGLAQTRITDAIIRSADCGEPVSL
jgi:predicted dehydrogenase